MIYHFETEQRLAVPIERIFLFFANPANLPRIMPRSTGAQLVRVEIVPPPGVPPITATVTSQGLIAGVGSEIVISIRLIPFLPFRMNWIAQITEFEWNHYFADDQKKGAFKRFHHRHELRSEAGGTVVRDSIDYDPGFGWIGALANLFFIAPLLRQMFCYRQQATEKLLTNPS